MRSLRESYSGRRLRKRSVIYQDIIKLKGTSHTTVIAIQVPRRLHNKKRIGNWIYKTNNEEVWISMNGKGMITIKEWEKIKKSIDNAFNLLKTTEKFI